jgi:hypothetical protein
MATKTKRTKEQEAANRVAELMYAALLRLPKKEQKATVLAIKKIKITRNRSRKTPKPSSVPRNFRQSSSAAIARRKRVHP